MVSVGSSTVNRYLHLNTKIDPKISARNKKAYQNKKEFEKEKVCKEYRYRPPSVLKDYCPGALIEKDVKFVPESFLPRENYHIKEHFNYQHSFIDSFTRLKYIEISSEPTSEAAKLAYDKIKERMPFKIATINCDNGGENGKDFKKKLKLEKIIQFYSRPGTPTDNPRVERSHLTDEKEFYARGNKYQKIEALLPRAKKYEHDYNNLRPHQALGYLTPMEFYKLWQKDKKATHAIIKKYNAYLQKQCIRLAKSRKLKKEKEIEKLMNFIDQKLQKEQPQNSLILHTNNCELCSWS